MKFSNKAYLGILLIFSTFSAVNGIRAQETHFAKPGPSGVYIFLGNAVPSGKTISAYSIERRENQGNWKAVANVKTPASVEAFLASVKQARAYFPSQVLPNDTRLMATYQKALQYGTVDSITGWKQYPVRVGLGLLFYDQNPPANTDLTYRVSEVTVDGTRSNPRISDAVTLPFTQVFDSIYVSELSRSGPAVFIKWCSSGKNAAPLFSVYRFDDRKPVLASGKFGRYTVNDTTFFTYSDSLYNKGIASEMQYFMVPYDLLGNAAKSSQIALFPADDFEKTSFKRFTASSMMEYGGIRLSWKMTNPLPVGYFTLYRSEASGQGFVKYASFKSGDTTWVDENTWPDKIYHYYLTAHVKNGKRIKNSNTVSASAFYPVKPLPPVISRSGLTEKGALLVVDITDSRTQAVRIFRGNSLDGSFTDISGPLPKTDASHVVFTDTTIRTGRKPFYYVARIECNDQLVSNLSVPVSVMPLKPKYPDDPSYLRAFDNDNMVKLFWEDLIQNDTSLVGYIIEKTADGGKSTVVSGGKATPIIHPFFNDQNVTAGTKYEYTVKALDRTGAMSLNGASVIITYWGDHIPVPSGLKSEVTGNKIIITWQDIQHPSVDHINIYRYHKGSEARMIASLPAGSNAYHDEQVNRKVSYHYFLTITDKSGSESSRSDELTVRID